MKRRSVRARLLAGTAAAIVVALAASGVLVYVLAKRAVYAQFDDGMWARARALSILVEREGDAIEYEDLSPALPPGEYFELRDGGGGVLLRSRTLAGGEAIEARRHVRLEFTPRGEDVDVPAGLQPTATIVFARATDDVDATVARLRGIVIGVGAGALVLALVVLAWVARAGLRPVDALAADIGAVPIGGRVEEDRPAELVVIARRLNELLGRVDEAVTRERQLTAEVAHELRTPLAGLRATIELALDRDRTPERYREALARSLAITRETERMVESMLALARLDAGMVGAGRELVEIDALVRDVLATHAARASERGLAVATELAAVTARTDANQLARVLHNLIDNAIAYADERGTITVEVAAGPTIRITNTGCTLSRDDVAHVFQRFWRGDAARTAGAHAGLGLAICQTIVALLGGTIAAAVEDGRFIMTVVLPDASDASRAVPD